MHLTSKSRAVSAVLVLVGAAVLALLAAVLDRLDGARTGEAELGRRQHADDGVYGENLPAGDQTRWVQRLIDAKCHEGGEVTLSGVYKTARAITVEGCQNLIVKGPATFDGSQPGRLREARHFTIRNTRDVEVEGITVIGGRCRRPCQNVSGGQVQNERQHGFEIAASERVHLRNVVVRNVWGDGVYVTSKTFSGGSQKRPADIAVTDSYIENSGRQGIAVSGVDAMVVERTVVHLANRSVFDFEAESGGARNITVRDSHIVEPDNATMNISCKTGEDGRMLNVGPFHMVENRVYGDSLKVNPFNCDLPAGLVVLRENEGALPLELAPLRP